MVGAALVAFLIALWVLHFFASEPSPKRSLQGCCLRDSTTTPTPFYASLPADDHVYPAYDSKGNDAS
jgi:hypothetical protein